jgi:hypothetical protein
MTREEFEELFRQFLAAPNEDRRAFIASKEFFWEYHRIAGHPYPGIVYGENCPPPPAGSAAPTREDGT